MRSFKTTSAAADDPGCAGNGGCDRRSPMRRATVARAVALGAAFVGIGPQHATRNAGGEISPYSPITRLFPNPIYLRVADVPELAHDEGARQLFEAAGLDRLDARPQIAWEEVAKRKDAVLRALHQAFERGRMAPRDAM